MFSCVSSFIIISKGFQDFDRLERRSKVIFLIGTPIISIYYSNEVFLPNCCYELLSHV